MKKIAQMTFSSSNLRNQNTKGSVIGRLKKNQQGIIVAQRLTDIPIGTKGKGIVKMIDMALTGKEETETIVIIERGTEVTETGGTTVKTAALIEISVKELILEIEIGGVIRKDITRTLECLMEDQDLTIPIVTQAMISTAAAMVSHAEIWT